MKRFRELSRRALGHAKLAAIVLGVGVALSVVVALSTKHVARSEALLEAAAMPLPDAAMAMTAAAALAAVDAGEAVAPAAVPLYARVEAVLSPARLAAMATELRLYPDAVDEGGANAAGAEMRRHVVVQVEGASANRIAVGFEDTDREVAQRVAQRLADTVVAEVTHASDAHVEKVVATAATDAKLADERAAHANEELALFAERRGAADASAPDEADAASASAVDAEKLAAAAREAKTVAEGAAAKLEAAKRDAAAGTTPGASRVAIVTPAPLPPEEGRAGLILAGLALSVVVAVAFAYGRVALSDTLVDAGDLENLGVLPVLGVMPRLALGPPTPGAPPPALTGATSPRPSPAKPPKEERS